MCIFLSVRLNLDFVYVVMEFFVFMSMCVFVV